MKDPVELALFGVFRPRLTSPGFAIPVFGDSSALWVQEIGDSGQVVRFIKCGVQAIQLLPAPMKIDSEPWIQSVGEQPIYAFQMPNEHVEVGTREMLAETLRIAAPQLANHCFVALDAAEFVGDREREQEARKACADLLRVSSVDDKSSIPKFGKNWHVRAVGARVRFDRYELVSQIGSGGLGKVYLALDTKLDRPVALKILHVDIKPDPSQTRRFTREAAAAAAINHPHISQIYDVGEVEGTNFIAMELIEGQTLRQRMRQSRIEVPDALDITSQVASALSALEAVGIVHRDLKPENIMLQQNGMVKVIDFGLAKILSLQSGEMDSEPRTSGLESLQPGQLIGTPHYMSPEQALGLPVDSRADIWALGVVLYEMLSGHLPFGQGSAIETLASILKSDPIPLSRYSHVPDEIERILNFALRKNPEERYQRAEDIAFDLKNLRRKYEEVYTTRPSQSVLSAISPPGQKLLRIAEFFFSPKTVTRTFKPLVVDWQFEYFEALKKKRGKWYLTMMTLRYYWYYAKACGWSTVAKFFKRFAKE